MENKNTSTVAFMADIIPAECECHKDHHIVIISMSKPGSDKPEYIHNIPFKTFEEAEKEAPVILKKVSNIVLKELGLSPVDATAIEVAFNNEAEKKWRAAMAKNNTAVH